MLEDIVKSKNEDIFKMLESLNIMRENKDFMAENLKKLSEEIDI